MKRGKGFLMLCFLLIWATTLSAGTYTIEITEGAVIRRMDDVVTCSKLATSEAFPFGFGQTYAFNTDSSFIAFIGVSDDTFELFVLSHGIKSAVSGIGEGAIDGRTSLEWSPDGSKLVFARGERIWMYDAEEDSAWRLSEPEDEWVEDFDPSFSPDGSKVFFFRGFRFEYVFSGGKYSINLDGTGLKKEEEEIPTYPPEDLRGEE